MFTSEIGTYQKIIDNYSDFSNAFSFLDEEDLSQLVDLRRIWEKLIQSIGNYIEWRNWKLNNSVPIMLDDAIESNYIDFLIINASSNLEIALKESILRRLEKEMHGITRLKDLVYFPDELDKANADYSEVQSKILIAVQEVVPLRGANPRYSTIQSFINRSSKKRKSNFTNLFKDSNLDEFLLSELVEMRNDIAHQNNRGYINPAHVAYCIWNSIEVSRIVSLSLLGPTEYNSCSDEFNIILCMEGDEYEDFISDMNDKHGEKNKVLNVFGSDVN